MSTPADGPATPSPMPAPAPKPDSGVLDQQVLQRTTERLVGQFDGLFGPDLVERYVFESYAALHRTSKVRSLLAAAAAHFAEERLRALAQSQGRLPLRKVQLLFVDEDDAGRAPLAAALAAHGREEHIGARSAGIHPAAAVDPGVLEALREAGVDPLDGYTKPLTDDVVRAATHVVSFDAEEEFPLYEGKQYLFWDVEDPHGKPPDRVRDIRDDLAARIHGLLVELRAPIA